MSTYPPLDPNKLYPVRPSPHKEAVHLVAEYHRKWAEQKDLIIRRQAHAEVDRLYAAIRKAARRGEIDLREDLLLPGDWVGPSTVRYEFETELAKLVEMNLTENGFTVKVHAFSKSVYVSWELK